MISFKIDSNSLRKPMLKQYLLFLRSRLLFIKINSKKHVVMKNFDNENAVDDLDNSAYFCEKHGKKCGHTLQVAAACCISWQNFTLCSRTLPEICQFAY